MASTARPLSLLQPPSTTSRPVSTVDHLTPLRRSRSPPEIGHYRRFSTYNSESSSEDYSTLSRSRSIIRSASFSNMGFSFKEKSKEKELGRLRKASDTTKSYYSSTRRPGSPLRTPPTQQAERPSSSYSLFALHKPKALKKKRSLASLLSVPLEETSTTAPPLRTLSTGATTSSPLASSSTSATPMTNPRNSVDRRAEYRQLQLEAARKAKQAGAIVEDTTWVKRQNMKVPLQSKAIYMQAYDPILLENDHYTDILLRRLNPLDSPSFHDYGSTPPSLALDLGCGPGHWLLEANSAWSQCSVVGFDLVDILIPEIRSQENIEFVRGDFLQSPWPFPTKTFDLVRMANLSLCIPYDKWETVLSEAQRVLAIDGRLELIDDQIFFPYAPPPATRPPSISVSPAPPQDQAPTLPRGVSFFEMDEDDDTLEDEVDDGDSMNTESTLISDGDTSPSHGSPKEAAMPNHDGDRAAISPIEPSLSSDDPNTPTSVHTITPSDRFETAQPLSSWDLDAASCRDMETVFEGMLNKKFGIHPRPSEFITDLMQHVLGNGKKLASFHLKLAPKDAFTGFGYDGVDVGAFEKEERQVSISVESKKVGQMINDIKKPWFNDLEKDEKRRIKKLNKTHGSSTATADFTPPDMTFLPPDTSVPDGLSAKAAGRLGITDDIPKSVSRVPDKLSAKAANRLGISLTPERKGEDALPALSPPSSPAKITDEPIVPPPAPAPAPAAPIIAERKSEDSTNDAPATESRLSAKAANRLGISYSALTAAAASVASSRRPQSSSSTLVSNTFIPNQSPGLIVWPSKFIPLAPSELEMHACKNIHTLIGCKPALAEYVEGFVDDQGARLENDDEFDQAIWDYECFRRRRFNWPAAVPEWDLDPDTEAPESASTLKSASTPKSANFHRTSSSSEAPLMLPADLLEVIPLYGRDELTHVRTLRVYEAVKTEEYSLSSLQFPRSPPPSPPH